MQVEKYEALHTKRHLDPIEINQHLENVEYIIMAAPAPDVFKDSPIHFTLFLNTQDVLPQEIQEAIFEKFCADYNISSTAEVLSALQPVAFAQTTVESAMPMLLVDPKDRSSIPHTLMHVIDFLGDSPDFEETKIKQLTGWSYSYND